MSFSQHGEKQDEVSEGVLWTVLFQKIWLLVMVTFLNIQDGRQDGHQKC